MPNVLWDPFILHIRKYFLGCLLAELYPTRTSRAQSRIISPQWQPYKACLCLQLHLEIYFLDFWFSVLNLLLVSVRDRFQFHKLSLAIFSMFCSSSGWWSSLKPFYRQKNPDLGAQILQEFVGWCCYYWHLQIPWLQQFHRTNTWLELSQQLAILVHYLSLYHPSLLLLFRKKKESFNSLSNTHELTTLHECTIFCMGSKWIQDLLYAPIYIYIYIYCTYCWCPSLGIIPVSESVAKFVFRNKIWWFFKRLSFLHRNLEDNDLSGDFPQWLANLPNLTAL